MIPSYLQATDGGTYLNVHLVPRARKNKLIGEFNGAIKVQIAAAPVDGKANHALLEYLAEALRIPKRALVLTRGDTSRSKQVFIELGIELVHERLRQLIE